MGFISSGTIGSRSGLRKNSPSTPKKVDFLRLDEKMQPIPWTEWPTGALVGAGSLWPLFPRHLTQSQCI